MPVYFFGIVYGVSNLFGPTLGGWLVEHGWAAVRRTDFLGAVISAVATICLMLGLTWGSSQTFAWSSPQVLGLLAVGVLLFALFLLAEDKARGPILKDAPFVTTSKSEELTHVA